MSTLASRLGRIELPSVTGIRRQLGSLWRQQPCALLFLRHYG